MVQKVQNGQFAIRTATGNVEVSWQITGTRKDAYVKAHPLQVEQDNPADPKGKYLHPDVMPSKGSSN